MNTQNIPQEIAGCRVVVEYITPARAKELLETNHDHQRRVNPVTLDKISRALRSDVFQFNGATIVISESGKVIDGQHRLLAAVNTKIGFWTVVVLGVSDDAFDTIDQTPGRKLRDVLTIHEGSAHVHLPTTILVLANYLKETLANPQSVSNAEAMDVYLTNPKLGEAVRICDNKLSKVICASRIAWLYYIATNSKSVDPRWLEFFDRLADGANLSIDDPIYQLRARLVADRSSRARLPRAEVLALLVKAWNAHVEKKRLKLLKWCEGEPFPRLNLS